LFRPLAKGVLAQLVERLNGIEEVRGSNPLGSTFFTFSGSTGLRSQLTGDSCFLIGPQLGS
jgi:hypothetical protein